jgi:hypothetical protein
MYNDVGSSETNDSVIKTRIIIRIDISSTIGIGNEETCSTIERILYLFRSCFR